MGGGGGGGNVIPLNTCLPAAITIIVIAIGSFFLLKLVLFILSFSKVLQSHMFCTCIKLKQNISLSSHKLLNIWHSQYYAKKKKKKKKILFFFFSSQLLLLFFVYILNCHVQCTCEKKICANCKVQ